MGCVSRVPMLAFFSQIIPRHNPRLIYQLKILSNAIVPFSPQLFNQSIKIRHAIKNVGIHMLQLFP